MISLTQRHYEKNTEHLRLNLRRYSIKTCKGKHIFVLLVSRTPTTLPHGETSAIESSIDTNRRFSELCEGFTVEHTKNLTVLRRATLLKAHLEGLERALRQGTKKRLAPEHAISVASRLTLMDYKGYAMGFPPSTSPSWAFVTTDANYDLIVARNGVG